MTIYYVTSETGSNSNNGTSETPRLLLCGKAPDMTKPGDAVEVMNGTYMKPGDYDLLKIGTSGTAAAPITYDAAPGREAF